MSNTDFDNGFACGVVLHIVRSGDMYQPVCRNDSGIYSYFYIDFRRAMMPFSLGMFNESILVYDSVQIRVHGSASSVPGCIKSIVIFQIEFTVLQC